MNSPMRMHMAMDEKSTSASVRVNPSVIVFDKSSYKNWEVENDDDSGFEVFAENIGSTQLSGVWSYSGAVSKTLKKDKDLTQEFDLFYIPDAEQAAQVFLHGFDDGWEGAIDEYTFWQSMK